MGTRRSILFAVVAVLAVVGAGPARALASGVATVAGGGAVDVAALNAGLRSPVAVAVDSLGRPYFTALRNRVYRLNAGRVELVAGNGTSPNYAGDGGRAVDAEFAYPSALAFDGAGRLYIADTGNHRVRRVDLATGLVTTIAGNGSSGVTGDGGSATAAGLEQPRALAFDAQGRLYIAHVNAIRRVDASGVITTLAGGFSSGNTGDGGPATAARLWAPQGIGLDGAGNVIICDTANNRVRAILTNGTMAALAGTGTSGLTGDGGPAVLAQLNRPIGVVVDGRGTFVVDSYNHRVRLISPLGVISTYAGTSAGFSGDGGPATAAQFLYPAGLGAGPGGALVIADTNNSRVRQIDAAPFVSTLAGRGDFGIDGPASQATLPGQPVYVAADATRNLWFSTFSHQLFRVDGATGKLGVFDCNGGLGSITGLTVTLDGDALCSDQNADTVWRINRTTGARTRFAGNGTGGYSGDGGPAVSAQLQAPSGLAIDKAGRVYIADSGNCRIRRVNEVGYIEAFAGNGDCAFSGDGGLAWLAGMSPHQLAMGGALYFTDGGSRVRSVPLNSMLVSTVAGNGTPGSTGNGGLATAAQISVSSIAADRQNNLYLSSQFFHDVRVVFASTGRIYGWAGSTAGFSGDEQTTYTTRFRQPMGLAVDKEARLYVADFANFRVRSVFTRLAKGDFDSFGATDLVLRDPSGATEIWSMNGATRLWKYSLQGLPSGWPIVGSDDFDRVGVSQLLLTDPNEQLFVQTLSQWQPSGSPRAITGTPTLPSSWAVAATADFNGDGSPDVLWRDEATQAISIWLLNGTSYTSTLTPSPAQATDANWEVVGASDLNGDLIPDLLWYNRVSGKLVYWLLDRQARRTAGSFTNPESAGNANWRPVATGDFGTGPGGLPDTRDVIWRNQTSGRLVLWHMDRAGNRTAGVFVSPDPNPISLEVVAPR